MFCLLFSASLLFNAASPIPIWLPLIFHLSLFLSPLEKFFLILHTSSLYLPQSCEINQLMPGHPARRNAPVFFNAAALHFFQLKMEFKTPSFCVCVPPPRHTQLSGSFFRRSRSEKCSAAGREKMVSRFCGRPISLPRSFGTKERRSALRILFTTTTTSALLCSPQLR